jgi:hypothetical protein
LFQGSEGEVGCLSCDKVGDTFYQENAGAASCEACPKNTYRPALSAPNRTSCICRKDFYSLNGTAGEVRHRNRRPTTALQAWAQPRSGRAAGVSSMPLWRNVRWSADRSVRFRARTGADANQPFLGPTVSRSMFRVAKDGYWGDQASPHVFTSCGSDPFFGPQCLAGTSNGSSSIVSNCDKVRQCETSRRHLKLHVGRPLCFFSSVATGGSVLSATMGTTHSSAAAACAPMVVKVRVCANRCSAPESNAGFLLCCCCRC